MTSAIKICGIKTPEEIALINEYPVTYIGFIFAKSKRQVTVDKARVLRRLVRKNILVVGVFMDQPVDYILDAVKTCGLDLVQLHGSETDEVIQQIPVPVWKSLAIKDGKSVEDIGHYPSANGLLLDTYHQGATGGTGKTFNWDLIKDITFQQTLILAGGLTPDNVVEAMNTVKPDIVDLNSGLETDLIKDPVKVKALFKAVGAV